MFIQIHTDSPIDSSSETEARIENRVRERLDRFDERLTHVAIHVSDVNGPRGNGLRATLEARVNGLAPVAVTEEGNTVDRAIIGAAKKAVRALDHQLGRLADAKGH